MTRPRTRMILSCLVIVIAGQVAGEYDAQGAEVMESPRVERMQSEMSDDCVGDNCVVHHSGGALGTIWFGPRLGRRRRSQAKFPGKGAETLGEVLGAPAYNFIDIPEVEAKRQEVAYTQRMGREPVDNYSSRNLMHRFLDRIEGPSSGEQEHHLTLPMIFTPRLGRSQKTPTLGHEIRDLLRKLQLQLQIMQ